MTYIGIDVGKNGGVAVIYGDGTMESYKCPKDAKGMADLIIDIKASSIRVNEEVKCIIEHVHAFPKQGVVSMFNFGKNYGLWLGILEALGVDYLPMPPKMWKQFYGKMPRQKIDRKRHLKQLAQDLYPHHKVTLAVADAILLAVLLEKRISE